MPCNNCNKEKPIANKKYNLCSDCNSIRLTGSSLQERQQQSALKYQQKALQRFRSKVTEETNSYVPNIAINWDKKRTPIRKQTSKDAKVKSALSELKKAIELEAVQNNEYYCAGCGKSHVGLDKSHLLSVGQFKYMELVKANIQLMCRTCHQIWEMGTIDQQLDLHCFVDNLIFIYQHDLTSYNKFITRIGEYKSFRFDDEKELIDLTLEAIQEGIELLKK